MKIKSETFDKIFFGDQKALLVSIHIGSYDVGEPIKVRDRDNEKRSMVLLVTNKEKVPTPAEIYCYSISVLIKQAPL